MAARRRRVNFSAVVAEMKRHIRDAYRENGIELSDEKLDTMVTKALDEVMPLYASHRLYKEGGMAPPEYSNDDPSVCDDEDGDEQ